jgi:RNA polymerase sigma-70 factor (ECF subfamily)
MAKTEDLLRAARAGDREALEAFLESEQPRIYRFGMRMCQSREDAEDVVQETMLAAARGLGDFRGGASVTTWLYAIARSFCLKKRRRSKFAPREEEPLDDALGPEKDRIADPARSPEEEVASRQMEAALERAIGALEPGHREVLVLRDVEGLTAPEVGDVLGLSVEAVKSRLHRARLAVRQRMASALGAPGPAPAGCPDVLSLFSRYLEGEIDSETCAEMERHLERCQICRGACDSLKKTLAMCRAAPALRVPDAVRASVRRGIRDFLASRG